MAGCAGPGAGPVPASGPPESSTLAGGIDASRCELGKEYWRASGPPKRGGVLTTAMSVVDQLDLTILGSSGFGFVTQVYNALLDYRGCTPEDVSIVPLLAKSWEVSPDGLVWTLKLHDTVKWHNVPPVNGRPFTSADVAWTIEHQKAGGQLGSIWRPVEHSEPDPHTLVLQLKTPDPDFPTKLAQQQNVMLPREVKEQHGDFRTVAIGTGAYVLKDFKPRQEMTLEANPSYYLKGEDGKPLPYLERVNAITFPDYSGQLAALRANQLDFMDVFGVRPRDLGPMRQSQPKLQYFKQLTAYTYGIWFNYKRPLAHDVRVRKAIALAINPDDQVASLGGSDSALRAGFLPPFFRDLAWSDEEHQKRYKPDPEQAKKLLAEAGYGPGQLKAEFKTGQQYLQEAEIAQEQLKLIGIDARLEVHPSGHIAALREGSADFVWGGRSAQVYPGYWVGELFRSGVSQNDTNFSDASVDQLIDAQAREMDPAARKRLLDQLQNRLYEVSASVPVVSPYNHFLIACRIRNWKPMGQSFNMSNVTHVWLDSTGC